jgi:ribosome-associated toxin RatA of RatAB toxin-antitoxin module
MHNIEKSIVTPFTQKELFEIIANVELYSQFIPGCNESSLKIINELDAVGTLHIDRMGISYNFSTLNTHYKYEKIILNLVKPNDVLSDLTGEWIFNKISDSSTEIIFKLQYNMYGVYKFALPLLVNGLADSMLSAFSQRAYEIKKND